MICFFVGNQIVTHKLLINPARPCILFDGSDNRFSFLNLFARIRDCHNVEILIVGLFAEPVCGVNELGETPVKDAIMVPLPVYSLEELGQHYESGEPIETVDGPMKLIGGENHYLEKKGESES